MTRRLTITRERIEQFRPFGHCDTEEWDVLCDLALRALDFEAERAAARVLPNLDDHPLQDPAAANRELRKLLYTVDADRKRSDAKVRELATEVWGLRKAMPSEDERKAIAHCTYLDDLRDCTDEAAIQTIRAWLNRTKDPA